MLPHAIQRGEQSNAKRKAYAGRCFVEKMQPERNASPDLKSICDGNNVNVIALLAHRLYKTPAELFNTDGIV